MKKRLQLITGSKNIFDVKTVVSSTSGGTHGANTSSVTVRMGRTYFTTMKFKF
jgi:outer membrane receptor protein involved in Fe transport